MWLIIIQYGYETVIEDNKNKQNKKNGSMEAMLKNLTRTFAVLAKSSDYHT